MKRLLLPVLGMLSLIATPKGIAADKQPPRVLMAALKDGEKEPLSLHFFGNTRDAKPRTDKVNVEPGCIMTDVIIKSSREDRVSLEFPEDGGMQKRALQALGLKGKKCVIVFKRSDAPNTASKIMEIKEE